MPAKTKKTKKPARKRLTLNAKQFSKLLHGLVACPEARLWCRGKSFHKAWNTCKNENWMYWFLIYGPRYQAVFNYIDRSADEIRRCHPADRVLRKVLELHGDSIGVSIGL